MVLPFVRKKLRDIFKKPSTIQRTFFKRLPGQLLILSTDEEISSKHLDAMKEQISHVYMLEYGSDKRTHICENQYFEV